MLICGDHFVLGTQHDTKDAMSAKIRSFDTQFRVEMGKPPLPRIQGCVRIGVLYLNVIYTSI